MTYPSGTSARIIEIALEEVGYVEEPDNLTKYGKYTKADGLPWCGSFCNWVYDKAEVKIPSMVSTAIGAHKMKELGRWIEDKPQIGDLCFMDFPHDGVDRISHIGIVAKVLGNAVVLIEGNTGDADQRNGGMVMIKTRTKSEIVGFARPKLKAYAGQYPVIEVERQVKGKAKK